MTDDQFRSLCNTYGFAPSRALRELVEMVISQAVNQELLEALKECLPYVGQTLANTGSMDAYYTEAKACAAINAAEEHMNLGITKQQLSAMQRRIDTLEMENDAIGDTPIRHAINERLVEIRLLLRDGHLKNKRGSPRAAIAKAEGQA